MAALILIPVLFALLRLFTKKYIFSALTSLSCAAIALPHAPIMAAALAVSTVGDYLLAHVKGRDEVFAMGVGGFLIGHLLFSVHALQDVRHITVPLIIGVILAAAILVYLHLRVISKVPKILKIPVVAYTLVSVFGFVCAMMTGNWIYIVGIALLLFSDTMIAENDFVGNKAAGRLVLPTYYPCHILVVLSVLI